jgi:hypothetical protein
MMILLRLIHILFAIVWAGTLLFTTFYLFPTLASVGPAAAPVMDGLKKRGFLLVMPLTALVTVLSGAMLLSKASGGSMALYSQTAVGRMFSMAGGLAILAFLIGLIVGKPAGEKLMKLTSQVATMPEGPVRAAIQSQITGLQARVKVVTLSVSVMVILAAAGMAVARYM